MIVRAPCLKAAFAFSAQSLTRVEIFARAWIPTFASGDAKNRRGQIAIRSKRWQMSGSIPVPASETSVCAEKIAARLRRGNSRFQSSPASRLIRAVIVAVRKTGSRPASRARNRRAFARDGSAALQNLRRLGIVSAQIILKMLTGNERPRQPGNVLMQRAGENQSDRSSQIKILLFLNSHFGKSSLSAKIHAATTKRARSKVILQRVAKSFGD